LIIIIEFSFIFYLGLGFLVLGIDKQTIECRDCALSLDLHDADSHLTTATESAPRLSDGCHLHRSAFDPVDWAISPLLANVIDNIVTLLLLFGDGEQRWCECWMMV